MSSTWWRHQIKYFPCYWPFVRGIHRSPVISPHKGQWRGAFIFSMIFDWMNSWINNREAAWWFETPSHPLWRHFNGYSIQASLYWGRVRPIKQGQQQGWWCLGSLHHQDTYIHFFMKEPLFSARKESNYQHYPGFEECIVNLEPYLSYLERSIQYFVAEWF